MPGNMNGRVCLYVRRAADDKEHDTGKENGTDERQRKYIVFSSSVL